MGLHFDGKAVNTTSLQEEEKLPPCDIKGVFTTGEYEGNRAPQKRASKASKKRKAMEQAFSFLTPFLTIDFSYNPSPISNVFLLLLLLMMLFKH